MAGRDHAALAEIYSGNIMVRCTTLHDDITRIYKKCREIGFEIHEEVLKVLHELHTAMKTHHTYQSEFRQAESKLAVVEKQKLKLKEGIPKEKLEKSRKYRLIEKEVLKRTTKYTDARLKATKARNEYLLCMDAANSSMHKYFVDDLSDLIDCMDYGFHQSLSRAMMMRSDALKQTRKSEQQDIDLMEKVLGALDSRLDKKMFLEKNEAAFMIPKKFEYMPVRRDETELVQKPVLEELESRKRKLAERISSLRAESEEIWKSLETAEKSLNDMVSAADYDTTRYFVEEEASRKEREGDGTIQKAKVDRCETEQFYLQKFREYILNSNRISRLQAKYDNIRGMLGDQVGAPLASATLPRPITNTRRRIGRTLAAGQPKLFGGSLEEYLEGTSQDVPQIIKGCVRIINLYGLHHQGIFRVSGSQVEINNFRDSFERGDDPLADMTDASDINSVAGVLKLYLRELREPVFQIQYFDHFMELAQLESKHEFVVKVRDVVRSWPRSVFIVMRYLFAFLNHLSEFSDENMMDPYNLAICFGPTLVPIPEERDQVQFQNLVNELIKNFIIFHEDIFPTDVPGPIYEKYLTFEPDDPADSPAEHQNEEETETDVDDTEATEDDSVFPEAPEDKEEDVSLELFSSKSEVLEAHALYDFKARSSREVNFRKGDTILLYRQVSNDWWRGSVDGREGLIPDKYIMLKIRGEDSDRDRLESARSRDGSVSGIAASATAGDYSSVTPDGAASLNTSPGRGASVTILQRERSQSAAETAISAANPSAAASTRPRNASDELTGSTSSPVAVRKGSAAAAAAATTTVTSARRASPTVISVTSSGEHSRVAGGGKNSKESLSMEDSGNQSPDTVTTSANRLSSLTDSRSDSLLESGSGMTDVTTATPGSNTHIIRVSGPVTNLDETVVSAAPPSASTDPEGARSRLPISRAPLSLD